MSNSWHKTEAERRGEHQLDAWDYIILIPAFIFVGLMVAAAIFGLVLVVVNSFGAI